jgi:serine/threonine protein kinase/formylglycine-generating enzyme required for sulfatase activity
MIPIDEYLLNLGLEKHIPVFHREKITLASLKDLEESDLKELGLPIGHRKILLSSLGKKPSTAHASSARPENEADSGVTVMEERAQQDSSLTYLEGRSSMPVPTGDATRNSPFVPQIAGASSLKRIPVSSGQADLYEGIWQGRKVALKWFRCGFTPKDDLMESIKQLDRKCVVEVLETGVFDERPYEIMEFIEHGNLGQWIKMGVAESRVREVVEELTNAVEELHRHNIIHRDIKPSNILVRSLNPLSLVLTDFGISSITNLSLHTTNANRTAAYSAPEAMTGVVGKFSDWWSVGVVIMEILTGRGAFEGCDDLTINYRLATSGIEVPADLDERWKMLIAGLLAQDPSQRWGGAQIRDWLAGKEIPVSMQPQKGGIQKMAGARYLDGEETQASVAYSFNGEKYPTASSLGQALGLNWEMGLKHYGRGLISRWVEVDLRDAEKVVKLAEFSENRNFTTEMQFALALLVLNKNLPFSWRTEYVGEEFCEQNSALIIDWIENGLIEELKDLNRCPEIIKNIEQRWNEYKSLVSGTSHRADDDLARTIIGCKKESLEEQCNRRRSGVAASQSLDIHNLLNKKDLTESECVLLLSLKEGFILRELTLDLIKKWEKWKDGKETVFFNEENEKILNLYLVANNYFQRKKINWNEIDEEKYLSFIQRDITFVKQNFHSTKDSFVGSFNPAFNDILHATEVSDIEMIILLSTKKIYLEKELTAKLIGKWVSWKNSNIPHTESKMMSGVIEKYLRLYDVLTKALPNKIIGNKYKVNVDIFEFWKSEAIFDFGKIKDAFKMDEKVSGEIFEKARGIQNKYCASKIGALNEILFTENLDEISALFLLGTDPSQFFVEERDYLWHIAIPEIEKLKSEYEIDKKEVDQKSLKNLVCGNNGEEVGSKLDEKLKELKKSAFRKSKIHTILEDGSDFYRAALCLSLNVDGNTNSIGMRFVSIVNNIFLSIWPTRVVDYNAFLAAKKFRKMQPSFEQSPNDPVVSIDWFEAKAFCQWLTKEERSLGFIGPNDAYRLPTDSEWSIAVGLAGEKGRTPAQRSGKIDQFPWSQCSWPPPSDFANYGAKLGCDDFSYTSPVGSFAPNELGLYDMFGNVWEWCEDNYEKSDLYRSLRGASFECIHQTNLNLSARLGLEPKAQMQSVGFRCVFEKH